MAANDFIRGFQRGTIRGAERTTCRRNGIFRVFLEVGVTSLILSGTSPVVNSATEPAVREPAMRHGLSSLITTRTEPVRRRCGDEIGGRSRDGRGCVRRALRASPI